MKKKTIFMCVTLVIETILCIVVANLIKSEEGIIDNLFMIGLGITIVGVFLNASGFKFLTASKKLSNLRYMESKTTMESNMDNSYRKPFEVNIIHLNILLLGIVLIALDFLAIRFDVFSRLVSINSLLHCII